MYWWNHAALLARSRAVERFGLITTNSIRQHFNRRVVQAHTSSEEDPLHILFAVPDHPWIEASDGAAVRISMTCASGSDSGGRLMVVESEIAQVDGEFALAFSSKNGQVNADLTIGVDVSAARPLKANLSICGQGIKVVGDGFFAEAGEFGDALNPATGYPVGRKYVAPKCITHLTPPRNIIDFFGMTEHEARSLCPGAYQQLLTRVRPKREVNSRESIRELWWRFGWDRPVFRDAV